MLAAIPSSPSDERHISATDGGSTSSRGTPAVWSGSATFDAISCARTGSPADAPGVNGPSNSRSSGGKAGPVGGAH